MSVVGIVSLALAGLAAGATNTVVGSGMAGGERGARGHDRRRVAAVLPASSFAAIVPGFVAIAIGLTVLQPGLDARFRKHGMGIGHRRRALASVMVYASAVYGGYFGAGQGIL